MKATKDHISLEAAKLLKDCGVESKYIFAEYQNSQNIIEPTKWECSIMKKNNTSIDFINYLSGSHNRLYPAYTWQEILWEYAEEFFGEDEVLFENVQDFKTKISMKRFLSANKLAMIEIGYLLQQKKYDEADEYFRKFCVLINNK